MIIFLFLSVFLKIFVVKLHLLGGWRDSVQWGRAPAVQSYGPVQIPGSLENLKRNVAIYTFNSGALAGGDKSIAGSFWLTT